MPARNITKTYVADGYYHIYSRGVNKQVIFLDKQDYTMFLSPFKRYLSSETLKDKKGREYASYHGQINLLAYCLMPNHFHALVFQSEAQAIKELFKSVLTAYSMYFNKKYKRVGPVFQSRYKASLILTDSYFDHISRYIHLNASDYQNYPYSSYKFYLGKKHASWLEPARIKTALSQ